jgi:hypothetical protein
MPGMNSGPDRPDPAVVAAFRAALLHQGLVALLILAVLAGAWAVMRARGRVGAPAAHQAGRRRAFAGALVVTGTEAAGRRLLRIGFGLLWLFDGILQAQPAMPTGLPSQVVQPTAGASEPWVQHLVRLGENVWIHHPVPAASAAVWIQIGLGIWLLAAPHGALSRLAGLASAGWGLIVWVFGESFGGIFAPGLTWLTGAPGSAAVYVAAGVLIAMPGRAWASPRLGQLTLAGLGLFLAVMAGLQAQPGLGYWRGTTYGQPGPLATMIQSMAQTPQPRWLSGWVTAFGAFDQAHGFAVNLVAVAALAAVGAAFLSGRRRLARLGLIAFTVLGLADWVLVQDLGFLGGVGTDPNSMIPFILLAGAGYLALVRPAAPVPLTASRVVAEVAPAEAS